MENLKFILKSNSSKQLDLMCKEIILCVKYSGTVKSGPICLKNERRIIIHNANIKTIDYLMKIKEFKRINTEVIRLKS